MVKEWKTEVGSCQRSFGNIKEGRLVRVSVTLYEIKGQCRRTKKIHGLNKVVKQHIV